MKSFIACLSTYSRIPMPRVELDSKDMKYAMIFFPFIGIVIGALECILYALVIYCNLPKMFFSLVSAVIPLVITGGIHVDGYMDTMDALNSYGDKEKKLSIMKDPHNGGFAVIKLAVFGLLYIAFTYLLNEKSIIPFALSFVISRTLSGISVCVIQGAKSNGMIYTLKENTSKRIVFIFLACFLAAEIVFLILYNVTIGAISFVVIAVFFYLYRKKCMDNFGGITGDTSGYYLCMMELLLLMIATLEGYL